MKISELKHNHSLTDLLKVILFSIVMLLPFFNVLTRSLYVICNKNAYQSYSETNVQKIEQIDNAQSYADTFTYNVKPLDTSHSTSGKQYYSYISIDNVNSNAVSFSIYSNQTNAHLIMFWDSNDVEVQRFTWGASENNAFEEFYFTKTSGNDLFNYANVFLIYETTDKLDNVFEYSVSKLEQSQLYNWTTQTAIYTGVSTMTTQLGITGNIIPIIVCYWFFMTIIYIIR